uniref:Uncharacterized protein n=1 Tax=Acrobeloides nanus TaxID=290746 RepID=A0A914CUA3_9BILA
MLKNRLLIFCLLTSIQLLYSIDIQSIRVVGKFMCADQPAPLFRITLYEEELGKMCGTYTTTEGAFNISGHKIKSASIQPYLNVFNKCNNTADPCQHHWKMELMNVQSYITPQKNAVKTFDIGTYNLEAKYGNCQDGKTIVKAVPIQQ